MIEVLPEHRAGIVSAAAVGFAAGGMWFLQGTATQVPVIFPLGIRAGVPHAKSRIIERVDAKTGEKQQCTSGW
jgi:hypothetical protein